MHWERLRPPPVATKAPSPHKHSLILVDSTCRCWKCCTLPRLLRQLHSSTPANEVRSQRMPSLRSPASLITRECVRDAAGGADQTCGSATGKSTRPDSGYLNLGAFSEPTSSSLRDTRNIDIHAVQHCAAPRPPWTSAHMSPITCSSWSERART